MTEEWARWTPVEGLAEKYSIESILEDRSGLTIVLSDYHNEDKGVRISFGYSADAYRDTYETFRSHLTYELGQRYGTDFHAKWTFFKVYNSLYIQWFSEQSFGISDYSSFVHFSFLVMDSVLDVVALQEPKVELIDIA